MGTHPFSRPQPHWNDGKSPPLPGAIGRDIQVAGYDGYLAMCEERKFEPGLPAATVSKQNQRMGEQMVEVLLDRIGGKLPEGPQTRVVRPRLVISDQSVRLGER